ncbi:MAG: MetS family NSS transporter small subunit [Cyclobacteriaceae bacterium]
MTVSTIISMAIILTIIVGGFGYFLMKAIRKEREQ